MGFLNLLQMLIYIHKNHNYGLLGTGWGAGGGGGGGGFSEIKFLVLVCDR